MRANPPTLRSQLLRGVLVPLSALLLADVTGSYFAVRSVTQDIYDGELGEIVRELELHVRSAGGTTGFDLSPEAERTLLLDQYDKVHFAVRAPDGRTIAGEGGLPAVQAVATGVTYSAAAFEGEDVRIAAVRVVPPARSEADAVVVEVAETLVKREMLARKLLLGVALPQVVLILATAALVWLGVRRGLAPLQRLRSAVAERSHLDISAIDARGIPGEVRPLVLAVNDLLRRLGDVLDFQSRFIADTAHQLRTPVAGLKAHIEVALREEDLTLTRRALAHLYVSAERLAHLVSQLLSLARNEPSTARVANFAPLDLNKLVFEATMEWVAEAYGKKIDLGFEAAGGAATVNGDPTRLTELVNNLVDNAIRYTQPGGRVTVGVVAGERPQIVVSDDGPRIPVEERERVFERFHRLLGTGAEGSGLGLAIVREIATLHGAEIALEDDDHDGIGNRFTVRFPVAAPAPLSEAEPAAKLARL
jgi:two-component system, OmpR family, sensor histidine kinase TctE